MVDVSHKKLAQVTKNLKVQCKFCCKIMKSSSWIRLFDTSKFRIKTLAVWKKQVNTCITLCSTFIITCWFVRPMCCWCAIRHRHVIVESIDIYLKENKMEKRARCTKGHIRVKLNTETLNKWQGLMLVVIRISVQMV